MNFIHIPTGTQSKGSAYIRVDAIVRITPHAFGEGELEACLGAYVHTSDGESILTALEPKQVLDMLGTTILGTLEP